VYQYNINPSASRQIGQQGCSHKSAASRTNIPTTITEEYDSVLGTNQDPNKVIGDTIKYFTTIAVQSLD
jgi:hypothetical protein